MRAEEALGAVWSPLAAFSAPVGARASYDSGEQAAAHARADDRGDLGVPGQHPWALALRMGKLSGWVGSRRRGNQTAGDLDPPQEVESQANRYLFVAESR